MSNVRPPNALSRAVRAFFVVVPQTKTLAANGVPLRKCRQGCGGPSVKLGRRTTAGLPAVHSLRLGRLPVFAVSEPSARLAQDALVRPARSSRYPKPRIEHSSTGVASRPRNCVAPSTLRRMQPPLCGCASPRRPARHVVLAYCASARCPPVLRTGSNSNAHAGYGVGLCSLRGCHVTESGLTWRSTGHPTAGHNGALRQGRAAVGCRLPLR